MNSVARKDTRWSGTGVVLCMFFIAVFCLAATEGRAGQIGKLCGKYITRDEYCVDKEEIVNIGPGDNVTHGYPMDPSSPYYDVAGSIYGTVNVLSGGLFQTNYTYYDNDKPNKYNYLVEARHISVRDGGTLVVHPGGRVLSKGAIDVVGYAANYGTWDNWFATSVGGDANRDREAGKDPRPRFVNYGIFNNNVSKYATLTVREGVFENYNLIESNGTINVHVRSNYPYNAVPALPYLINHRGALIRTTKGDWIGSLCVFGGVLINDGTIYSGPGVHVQNSYGGTFINNGVMDSYGSFQNYQHRATLFYKNKDPIPSYVPTTYFENNGYFHNHAGATFSATRMANVVNNGTFINDGDFTFTRGIWSGWGPYAGRPEILGGDWSYFKNKGLFRNNGTVTLLKERYGELFEEFTDGWVWRIKTLPDGTGSMTNEGIITGKGSWVGDIINEKGGIVAPGDSIGTMTITGNYTSKPGSTLEIELDPVSSDQLIISGTATLNKGYIQPVYAGIFQKNVPYTYTFLTAASGVAGTFEGVVNPSAFFDMSLTYFPTFVNLNLMRRSFTTVCETENQCAVADGIERGYPVATGDFRDVINILLKLNAPEARNAFDQMGGYIHTSIPAVTFSSFGQYRNMMITRMAGFVSGGPSSMLASRPIMMASRSDTGNDAHNTLLAMGTGMPGDTAERRPPTWGFWAEGYGSLGQRRANDISSIYDYNTAGFILGFDRKIAPSLLFGGTAGYSYTKVDLKDLSEDAKISSYQGALYGIYTKGLWYASGIASYAYSTYDTMRDIAFGGLRRAASVSYNGHLAAGYIEGGYKWKTRYADIIPLASFQAVYLWRGGFSEDGAGSLGLNADRENVASYLASLGLRVRKDWIIKAGTLSPELKLRWDHEFSNENHVLNASFTGYPQTTFTVRADRPDRDRLATGAGLVLKTKGNVYLNLSYEGYFSNDTTQHSGMVGLQYRW